MTRWSTIPWSTGPPSPWCGSSYGAYLGTVLSTFRPVRWMSLRVPALYRDEHWSLAKGRLDRMDLSLLSQ